MPKQIDRLRLDAVVQAVAQFSDGASVDEIGDVPEISLPCRTLQRRLAICNARCVCVGV
jgi:hypothetical protein